MTASFGDRNAAAILCDRLAAWWSDASAGDMPRALAKVERVALAAYNAGVAEWQGPERDDDLRATRAAIWTSAAARLRAHALHAAADAAEETTR